MTHILTAEPMVDISVSTDKPTSRCCFNYFVRLRNINGDRDLFHAYVTRKGRNGQTLQLWQWDSLLQMYEARDEAETVGDVLAGSHW